MAKRKRKKCRKATTQDKEHGRTKWPRPVVLELIAARERFPNSLPDRLCLIRKVRPQTDRSALSSAEYRLRHGKYDKLLKGAPEPATNSTAEVEAALAPGLGQLELTIAPTSKPMPPEQTEDFPFPWPPPMLSQQIPPVPGSWPGYQPPLISSPEEERVSLDPEEALKLLGSAAMGNVKRVWIEFG